MKLFLYWWLSSNGINAELTIDNLSTLIPIGSWGLRQCLSLHLLNILTSVGILILFFICTPVDNPEVAQGITLLPGNPFRRFLLHLINLTFGILEKIKIWVSKDDSSFKLLELSNYGSHSKKLVVKVLKSNTDMKDLLDQLFNYLNSLEVYKIPF